MNDCLAHIFPQPQHIGRGEGWLALGDPATPCTLVVSPSADPMEQAAAARIRSALPGIFADAEGDASHSAGAVLILGAAARSVLAGELAALPDHPEAYCLSVDGNRIGLVGRGTSGTLYATETLLQIVRRERGQVLVPRVTISDWPDLRFRGLYVESKWGPDLMTLDDWKELIDLMVRLKLNSLGVGIYGCWGLQYPGQMTEWVMVPFPKYPRLRTPKDIRYYSPKAGEHIHARYLPTMVEQDLFGEVVAYGRSRGVVVRPHFNGPGHNTVIPREYPDVSARDEQGNPTGYGYCLTGEATYTLLFDLYDSIVERYLRPNGVTWWHMGMDEVYPVEGIDPADERRLVDPWCKCPRCRATSREDLLLDFAFRCLHHLREQGMDNITIWYDCLERMGITDRFGQRLEAEGLKPYVVVQWWRYGDMLPTPRSDVSRTWVTPMAGYYNWMFHGSYLFNIGPFLRIGHEHGSEGADAYCTYDHSYHRNYTALSELAWNRSTSGMIDGFQAKYAAWLFPDDARRGTEALHRFDEVFGSPPARAMLDNLIYYWYSYPARRIDYPRELFCRLLDDRTRTLNAIETCVPPLSEARRLLGEFRAQATDQRLVDNLIFECQRVLMVVGAYRDGLRAIQHYRLAAGSSDSSSALDRANQAAQAALNGMENLLADYERVKPYYLQPQGMRDLTYLRDFVAALRDELADVSKLAEAGRSLPDHLATLGT